MRHRSITVLVTALVLSASGCGSGQRPVANLPPPPVGKGTCLAARSTALAILSHALQGAGPMSTRLRIAERRAAGTLRSAAHQISALEAATGTQARGSSLAPSLAGSARRLNYLAGRLRRRLPADALAAYGAVGQMIYDACT